MSDSLQEHLAKSGGGLIPVALLQAGVQDRAIRLYALVRSLGSSRDTYRGKDSLATALGWGRTKTYEAALELEALGWLTRTRKRRGSTWTSTWTAHDPPVEVVESPLRRTPGSRSPRSRTPRERTRGESATADKRRVRHSGQEHPTFPPPTPHPPSGWAGTQLAELDLCFASLTSWEVGKLPQGHERVREALASVLARPTAPRGVTGEQLVMAWLDRLTGSQRGLGGMGDPEAVLIAAARKRDAAADALAYREAVAEGRKRPPAEQTRAPPESQGETEQVDLSALERISSRQASPTTTRQRRLTP